MHKPLHHRGGPLPIGVMHADSGHEHEQDIGRPQADGRRYGAALAHAHANGKHGVVDQEQPHGQQQAILLFESPEHVGDGNGEQAQHQAADGHGQPLVILGVDLTHETRVLARRETRVPSNGAQAEKRHVLGLVLESKPGQKLAQIKLDGILAEAQDVEFVPTFTEYLSISECYTNLRQLGRGLDLRFRCNDDHRGVLDGFIPDKSEFQTPRFRCLPGGRRTLRREIPC